MASLFTHEYVLLWATVLAVALFLPVRRLIWVTMVRRAERRAPTDEAVRAQLRQRAGISAALISFVFSYLYTSTLFPAP